MKKISILVAAAAFIALFVGATAPSASATPAFSFSESGVPFVPSPTIKTFSFTGVTVVGGLPSTNATLYSTIVGTKYNVFLIEGATTFDIITGGSYAEIGAPFFTVSSSDGAGSFNITGNKSGVGIGGTYSPVPEAGTAVALGAMLLAGGLVLVANKRRSASTIA